jgi:flavin-dependent dehydrogenase
MTADCDVIVAGAGPAGAFAAYRLARQGARVTLIERCRFPRPKLCGDTLNPGAVRLLAAHFDLAPLASRARPLAGMLLTGPGPVTVIGQYGGGACGLAVTREVLDAWLVERAVAAGTRLLDEVSVAGPERGGDGVVSGVRLRSRRARTLALRAPIVLGADGRRSTLGEGCGLSSCAAAPRRWAIGAYFEGVDGLSSVGEMHVRDGHYIGVAPTPDGRANACLVQPHTAGESGWRTPEAMLGRRLACDPVLGPRFARARAVTRPMVLGPLAIETLMPGCPGLLLIGDAAGFVDPMTGDGIRLALVSAETAAATVAEVLGGRLPPSAAHRGYAAALRARVGRKRAFNRALRRLVSSPRSVSLAAGVARLWPGAFRAAIRYAGDVVPGHTR